MSLRPLNEVVEYLELRHAQDQEQIADSLVLSMFPLWFLMDFERLDETSMLFTESALPQIRTSYLQSQHVAAAFVENVRFASLATAQPLAVDAPSVEYPVGVPVERFELPDTGPDADVVPLDPFPEDDVRISLLVEGNFNIKSQMPVTDPVSTMKAAQVNSTGAAVRQSLKGARNVTANVVKFDKKVLGYARYTDGNPCHFCALLASRGAVYGRDSFADSGAKFRPNDRAVEVPSDYIKVSRVHNNCRCTLRPVYSKSQEFDSEAKFYRQQWERISSQNSGKSPDEIAKVWRDQYEPYQRVEADVGRIESALRDREMSLLREGFEPDSPQVRWSQRMQSLLA